MKKTIWITLAVTVMFCASVKAARAESNFYDGGSVEERAAMMSPEKTAYLDALRKDA